MGPGLTIAFGVVVAILVVVGSHYVNEQRRKAWIAMAERLGLRPSEGDPRDLKGRLGAFGLFNIGHSKRVERTMEGERKDRPLIIFEYKYTTGSGKNQQTHRRTGLSGELPFDAPGLVIRPEHFGDRLANLLGFDDIDFEYDEFNRAFHVSGEDKKFAYDVCHGQMMELLLAGRHLCWELRGRRWLVHSKSGTMDEGQIASALNLIDGFREQLPDYLARSRTS